ncbi:MAG: division plane positioning ATPase MipZ [Novosphingobium sp.]
MGVVEFTRRDCAPVEAAPEGEHPRAILADIARRPHHFEQVITVANEKGGAGKSTLAAHIAVSLANAGYRVLAIDLDRRQRSLSRFFSARDATARRLGVGLPMVRHMVLNQTSGAMLFQEIARAGPDCQVVVIDAPGADSPIVRRAIAMADKLVTPVNLSFVDLDLLAHFNPVTHDFVSQGCFAEAVQGLAETRAEMGIAATDWIVVPNRLRGGSDNAREACFAALRRLTAQVGFRLGTGLGERAAFRELQLLGLTQLDLQYIPALPRAHSVARKEILRLHGELRLEAPGQAMVRKAGLVPA